MTNYKKKCSMCGVPGATETYFNKTTGQYGLRVICKNTSCRGNFK